MGEGEIYGRLAELAMGFRSPWTARVRRRGTTGVLGLNIGSDPWAGNPQGWLRTCISIMTADTRIAVKLPKWGARSWTRDIGSDFFVARVEECLVEAALCAGMRGAVAAGYVGAEKRAGGGAGETGGGGGAGETGGRVEFGRGGRVEWKRESSGREKRRERDESDSAASCSGTEQHEEHEEHDGGMRKECSR